jgi:hypothetical protein
MRGELWSARTDVDRVDFDALLQVSLLRSDGLLVRKDVALAEGVDEGSTAGSRLTCMRSESSSALLLGGKGRKKSERRSWWGEGREGEEGREKRTADEEGEAKSLLDGLATRSRHGAGISDGGACRVGGRREGDQRLLCFDGQCDGKVGRAMKLLTDL